MSGDFDFIDAAEDEAEADALSLLLSTIEDKRPKEAVRPKRLRFAFYARVSTEEDKGLQDPEVSRKWQYDRAYNLIKDQGDIVTEFFDTVSRSKAFLLRPAAVDFLNKISDGKPPWDALVIGEAKRVFYGSQLEDVYYLLQRAGVELWIPEVGGKYDDNNITHKMILSLEGIMGKVETDTVRGRVRDAMTAIATSTTDRRWLGGNAPYGYRLVMLEKVERRGSSAQGSKGKGFTQTLERDPETAPIARRIFVEFINGKSIRDIAYGLEQEGIPSPTGRDTWHISTISTILSNQTYTGHRVYGKQRKIYVAHEGDPRLGTDVKKTRHGTPPVLSSVPVFPPIVTKTEFARAANLRKIKKTLTAERKATVQRTGDSEPLRGRVYYEGRKMTLDRSRHGKARYRWRGQDGSSVFVYDEQVREVVHLWLSENLSRRNLPLLIKQLKNAAPKAQHKIERIQTSITKAKTAASNLLTLVELGDEGAIERYQSRIAEVRELEIQLLELRNENLDVDGVVKVMRSLATETRKEVLDKASNKRLNRLYDALGLRVDYLPEEGAIRLKLTPTSLAEGFGAGISHNPTPDPSLVDTRDDGVDRVWQKNGAPGGSSTLHHTPYADALFTVVLELRKVA